MGYVALRSSEEVGGELSGLGSGRKLRAQPPPTSSFGLPHLPSMG